VKIKHQLATMCLIAFGFNSLANADLKGEIRLDGSSTVFPISEAVAEEFGRAHRGVRVTVGTSGTGGGFKKFVLGEIDINNASREMKKEEKAKADANKLKFIGIPIAYDGITIVISPKNTWVDYLTVDELKKLWAPGSKVATWKDLRAEWPAEKIILYGPGPDSGTFDFFTETINGKAQASRPDFTKSEDDNVLVQGVSGDKNALGYFGFAYFNENRSRVKAVPIKDGAAAAVSPSADTIKALTYKPLSRKVFIYVSDKASKRHEVQEFVRFYLTEGPALVKEVGFIPMPDAAYTSEKTNFQKFVSLNTKVP
jgi:phosphate transport system substrate-binding protein